MTPPEPEDTARPDTHPEDGSEPEAASSLPAGEPAPAGRGHAELPDDVDAAFAAIVASWPASDAPRWPDGAGDPVVDGRGRAPREPGEPSAGELSSGVGLATPPEGGPAVPPHGRPPPALPEPSDPGRRRDAEPGATDGATDGAEHFIPPEPPPLPRLGMSSLLGLLLLVVGVVLLAVPGLLGASVGLGIVPGLLAMTAGLGWLVFGMRRASEREGGPDEDGVL